MTGDEKTLRTKGVTANRSSEELSIREAVVAWGRARWPEARVMHELVVGGCRIDLAFVSPDHIAGVEIKSSRDVLNRMPRQLRDFTKGLPEVWIAFSPKWAGHMSDSRTDGVVPWSVGLLMVQDGTVETLIPTGNRGFAYRRPATVDMLMTADLLHLAHLDELRSLGRARGLKIPARANRRVVMSILARKLTGDEIIHGVCHWIRSRPRGWDGDEPVLVPYDPPQRV